MLTDLTLLSPGVFSFGEAMSRVPVMELSSWRSGLEYMLASLSIDLLGEWFDHQERELPGLFKESSLYVLIWGL